MKGVVMQLEMFLKIEALVGAVTDLGAYQNRHHRFVPITGGIVTGHHKGTILDGGVDWQDVRSAGLVEVNARYVLALEEGLVEVESRGVRAATPEVLARIDRGEDVEKTAYYFRTMMRFSTSCAPLEHFNRMLAIGVGERRARSVLLDVYRVP